MASLGRDWVTAWRGMLEWPAVSWLWPQTAVCLYLPTGARVLSRSLETAAIPDEQRANSARLVSVLLPEDLLLRRTLELPMLQAAELHAALALEVQALSPFPVEDVVWTYESVPHDGAGLHVSVVLSSRKLVAQHLTAVHPQLALNNPEVWVPRASAPGFSVLPGYGEARRQRQSAVGRWASAALAAFALVLVGAIFVTPSAQLYLRALQAQDAMLKLQKNAGPVLTQREAWVRTTEQLASLSELTGRPLPPLQVINLITEALPDDTSLLSLQIQGLKVSINGQTNNASALMKKLGATPGLSDVKAPTPAVKPLGAPRETFTIEFTLDPAPLRPAQ